jgi:hypothetical protein
MEAFLALEYRNGALLTSKRTATSIFDHFSSLRAVLAWVGVINTCPRSVGRLELSLLGSLSLARGVVRALFVSFGELIKVIGNFRYQAFGDRIMHRLRQIAHSGELVSDVSFERQPRKQLSRAPYLFAGDLCAPRRAQRHCCLFNPREISPLRPLGDQRQRSSPETFERIHVVFFAASHLVVC